MYKRVSTNLNYNVNNIDKDKLDKELINIVDEDDNLDGLDDETDKDNVYKNSIPVSNKYKKFLYNVSSVITRLKSSSICKGISKSWFISSCIGIYLKYFLIYKCSKKTPENYNYMIKNITTKLSEKNLFFIKIFQAFANNNNIMDKDLFNYFITYTDKVTYDTTEIDYNGLYDLINIARANGDELLIDNEQPIKSGNIALVYNGRLNGKRIIVKYRRKNIEIKFKRSMEELQILINITKHMPYLSDLNINDLFEENYQIMLNQLIFSNEVKNIQMFYEKFKDVENICIPKVYSYFTDSNPEVIVMDYIEGKRIENIDSEDKDEYSKILSRFNLKCVFYDAIYHADLHSGNVIFIKDAKDTKDTKDELETGTDTSTGAIIKLPPKLKIGVIDYGIIGTMTREEQNVFFMFFKVLVSKNYRDLALFIVENLSDRICIEKPAINDEQKEVIVGEIDALCSRVLSVDNKFFGGEEIYEINKILKKENMKFSKFFCRVELAIAISENVCNSLCKKLSYLEQMMIAFKEIFGDDADNYM
jgi:predicted unusual protein kinase regulating ubiquinone biosynthesis (AarF/ABC1/UbiB family)